MAGIYIHIPYCRKACIYCDFHFSTVLKSKTDFCSALLQEHALRSNYLNGEIINTLYFGGGTPSVLSEKELSSILDQVFALHSIAEKPEITLECNPDDLTEEYLLMLKRLGINRLSIGLQSFVEDELNWMNRSHNAKQSESCIKRAQDIGFSNISIDLIYGSKYQSGEIWLNNLKKAFRLKVQHISAYNLTVEEKTVLGNYVKKKKEALIDDELSAQHFEVLVSLTKENKFIHYEISNFCKEGFISQHNSNYWKGEKYLGLGPSAHSFNGVSRQWNISNNNLYIKNTQSGNLTFEVEVLSSDEQYNEYVLTGLRTIWGINLTTIHEKFGLNYFQYLTKKIIPYLNKGLILKQNETLVLSESGKLFADKISSDLFIV